MSGGKTERTIRHLAKDLAKQFYERKRGDAFSRNQLVPARALRQDPKTGAPVEIRVRVPFLEAYPTAHHYATAYWPHFYEAARKCLVTMLANPKARSSHLNEAIYEALVEDRQKQLKTGGKELIQRDPFNDAQR